METIVLILLIAAVLGACAFVACSNGQKGLLSLSLKSVASFLFTFLAVAICYTKGLTLPALFMVMGFVASCFGDVILGLPDMPEMREKSKILTLIGGLCFTIAHTGYMAFMIMMFGFAWWVILIAVALGLLIATLCIPTKIAQENPSVAPVDNSNNTTPIAPINQEPARPVVEQQPAESEKIEKIKQLHADGVISKEEMKRLIIREIEKN